MRCSVGLWSATCLHRELRVIFTLNSRGLVNGRFSGQGHLHDANGGLVQLMAIAVDTSMTDGNAAHVLRNHALSYYRGGRDDEVQ